MVIEEARLSSLQLETVVYACQQHMNILADGTRAGFLVGMIFYHVLMFVCMFHACIIHYDRIMYSVHVQLI